MKGGVRRICVNVAFFLYLQPMKHTYIAILSILILAGCRQQETELVATPGATVVQDTAAQDTAQPTPAPATPTVAACQVEAPLLLPPDSPVVTEASLQTYLKQFEDAVLSQDAEKLEKLVDPNIRIGFGDNGGWQDFADQWHLEDKQSEVWLQLEHLIRLGGGYPLAGNKELYALPYVYSNWPDSIDAFMHIAVIKDNAILRADPAANADAVCSLHQVILKVDYGKSYPEGAPQKEWWHVQNADGELQGYLNRSDVHSPVGYRAIFNKNKRGQWQMTALVTGD